MTYSTENQLPHNFSAAPGSTAERKLSTEGDHNATQCDDGHHRCDQREADCDHVVLQKMMSLERALMDGWIVRRSPGPIALDGATE